MVSKTRNQLPVSLVIAPRTRLALVGTTVSDDLWWWQVCNRGNPFGGIRSIRPRTEHGLVLLARMLGSELYDERLTGAIPKPGKDTIVSKNLPRHAGPEYTSFPNNEGSHVAAERL